MAVSSPTQAKLNKNNRENDWRLFLKLAPYARRNLGTIVVCLVLLLPLSIAGAIQPLIIGQAISLLKGESTWSFFEQFDLSGSINILIGLLICSIIVRLAFSSLQNYLMQRVGQEITAGIRDDLFVHVTSLATKFFDRTPVGKLITRLTSDVEALGDVFATGAVGILGDVVNILVITVTIYTLEWRLASLLILLLIPVSAIIVFFQKQYREANYRARDKLSEMNSILVENVSGINIVQLFRRERYNAEMFRTVNARHREEVDRTIFYDSAISATLEWIGLMAIAGVLWLGGSLMLQSSLELGVLSAFILYAQRFFDPLRRFAEKFTMFQAGFTAIERISELMAEPIDILDPEELNRKNLEANYQSTKSAGEIRFENVWFAYKEGEYVIKDLNFTITPGEKIALVGPTGAGKSSIIRLLCRLYEPTKGRIVVDGIDIRDLRQAELRRYIGVILQESFLFAGDVSGNITLGEDYSFEEVKKAAKLTNIDKFIEDLPQGYNTPLRERGANLSGGQKQLLAFARVAIRDPRILVLDEATASLDVGTEALIQEALDYLLEQRTAIIIAHRLSTIRNVDRIFVLKRGELVESGSHDDLLALEGVYASLYKLQMLGQ